MKTGGRKFLGFVITIVLYTVSIVTMMFKSPNLTVDISAFAVQSSLGYAGIAGLFFTGNVLEHFANRPAQPTPGPSQDGTKTEGAQQ